MSVINILLIGGAGFIGSHMTKMLKNQGYQPIVFDNLSSGYRETVKDSLFFEGDLANPEDLNGVFNKYPISVVMHFAALIDVGESVLDPLKYYVHNVAYTLNLLEAMKKFEVKILIFSSSAAIFGIPQVIPIQEKHPCHPMNPYGQTKWVVEKILEDCDKAFGIKSICLRYFNAAGGDPEHKIKNYKKKESNLIPLVLHSLKDSDKNVTIYGIDYPTKDGTCIRDYIHIEDLGNAHILAMKKLLKGGISESYNLGNGNGFSVREVIRAAEEVTGLKVKVVEGLRRPGDPPILVADSQKAREELGWKPVYQDLREMILHAWEALK